MGLVTITPIDSTGYKINIQSSHCIQQAFAACDYRGFSGSTDQPRGQRNQTEDPHNKKKSELKSGWKIYLYKCILQLRLLRTAQWWSYKLLWWQTERGPVGTLHLVASLLAANNQSRSQSARWTIWHTEDEWWARYRARLIRVLPNVSQQFIPEYQTCTCLQKRPVKFTSSGSWKLGNFKLSRCVRACVCVLILFPGSVWKRSSLPLYQ